MTLQPTARVGPYLIQQTLGAGGSPPLALLTDASSGEISPKPSVGGTR